MTALLGLLAIAGYQNRDKLFKMLGDLGKPGAAGKMVSVVCSVSCARLLARPIQVAC